MDIYFIRHGETVSNQVKKVQGVDDPLSETGIEQVKKLAERLIEVKPEAIYTSSLLRAVETSKIISEKLNLPINQTDLLAEIRRPSKLVGLSHNDPWLLEHNEITKKKKEEDPHWTFEDGEGFLEFKQRALDVLKFISSQKEQSIVVVTHGGILMAMLACMLFGVEVDYKTYDIIQTKFHAHNTGISKCRFKTKEGDKPDRWHIINWNDVTHL